MIAWQVAHNILKQFFYLLLGHKDLQDSHNKYLVQLLYRNRDKIDELNCSIKKMDAYKFIKEEHLVDLILVDPPYGQKDLNLLIKFCLNMLSPGGILVLETSIMDEHIKADSERIYGSTRLSFWRK